MTNINSPVVRAAALVALAGLQVGAASGSEWYVAWDGNGSAGTNWPTACTNLQDVATTASTGDRIFINAVDRRLETDVDGVDMYGRAFGNREESRHMVKRAVF